jgi:hypothetical protein
MRQTKNYYFGEAPETRLSMRSLHDEFEHPESYTEGKIKWWGYFPPGPIWAPSPQVVVNAKKWSVVFLKSPATRPARAPRF